MNFKNLSLKKLLGDDWEYNPDFSYADVHGTAECDNNEVSNRFLLFRREKEEEAAVISLHRILWDDKKTVRNANKLLADIGIDIRIGDKIEKIVKKFGTPTFIDHSEEYYYNYCYRLSDFDEDYYDYHDDFYIVRYYYLLSPSLLICFGIPKREYRNNFLTDIEILNDQEIASKVLQARMDAKKLDSETCKQKSVRYVNQNIENETIAKIQSKRVRFVKIEAKNTTIKEIESDDIQIRNCVFDHVILEGLQAKDIEIQNCIFSHVTFRNHYNNHDSTIMDCEFIDCMFYDTIEKDSVCFHAGDNLFKNCLFEGNRVEKGEKTYVEVWSNTFLDCIFQNIRWTGIFCGNRIMDGKMKHIFYENGDIRSNQFSKIQMEDVEVELNEPFSDNMLNSVIFRKVEITKHIQRNNCFFNCDTSGLEVYTWVEE